MEDVSQAVGAKRGGRISGAFGEIACFSMNPMKALGACGEAGAVVTDSAEVYEALQILRYNGTVNKETCINVSLNGRMDTLQAAILSARLPRLEGLIGKRREIAEHYTKALKGLVATPDETAEEFNSYYSYTIQTEWRDELKGYLEERGIETKIQHPILMPNQPAYREWTTAEKETAEKVVGRILCLPASEKLRPEEQAYVIETVTTFITGKKA